MTTTPITPERLSEIAALCEAATPGPWRQDCQIRVVAGPDSNPTDIIDYDHALHGEPPGASKLADLSFIAASRTAIPDLLAEIERLQGVVLRLANNERDLAETNLVLEQQDRDLARLRSDLDHATAHDGDHLSKASRRMVDTVMGERDALRAKVKQLNETAPAAGENWMAACKQRDEARARIAALETGLRVLRRDTLYPQLASAIDAILQGAT